RRKTVPSAHTDCVSVGFIGFTSEELVREEPEPQITGRKLPVPVFRLNTCLRGEIDLNECVCDVVLLERVRAKAVRAEVAVSEAERHVLVDPGQDTFTGPGVVVASEPGGLECHSISIEERIELVERQA